MRHDTPNDVACELAKHVPARLRYVLDPAVGSGALLMPFTKQLREQSSRVFCVDLDETAISRLPSALRARLPRSAAYINADFLSWSHSADLPSFDCIVMNPPFAAGKPSLRRVVLSRELRRVAADDRFMPLEAAFVCRAVDLLREGGRLLAVLPCSVVMSQNTQWLRNLLLGAGAIRFVHELPPRTFPGVESRMYLFVFDKGMPQRKIVLFNHDLADPERLDLWLRKDRLIERLDFGHHRAFQMLNRLMLHRRFGWQAVGDVAVVLRGDVGSPQGVTCAVHTSDYDGGFWRRSGRHKKSAVRRKDHAIRRGDLLVQRVGRDCHRTFGRPTNLETMPCSDCVLLVRPNAPELSTRLLFSLRAIFELPWAKPLLERGTGASYVSHAGLLKIPVPMRLSECFPKTYASFVESQRRRSQTASRHAVQYAARALERICRRD
ncbi:MAG TPA: N-6 DNA methylase [Pirellulales bacterium]|jgi:tRNA1(Val) A37 N6-methylase TrmN6|nr:N-6 DNA methylase [Pirellulales bacterium]